MFLFYDAHVKSYDDVIRKKNLKDGREKERVKNWVQKDKRRQLNAERCAHKNEREKEMVKKWVQKDECRRYVQKDERRKLSAQRCVQKDECKKMRAETSVPDPKP